ncbi:hypothetical protein JHK85_001952 [Glycine max]|nr:hypothetical protein JHK85_001952 [Glycine max]
MRKLVGLEMSRRLRAMDTGEFDLELEKPTRYVPWCSVDPYPSLRTMDDEMAKFPLYFNGPRPFECTVKAGEPTIFDEFKRMLNTKCTGVLDQTLPGM